MKVGVGVGPLVPRSSCTCKVLFVKKTLQFCQFTTYYYEVEEDLSFADYSLTNQPLDLWIL